MSEKLKTRREVVAEGDSPKPELIENIETLQKLGVFIPMSSLDLYHGRAGDGSSWHVVDVNNAGNATGNRNINRISALNTGERDIATAFAAARSLSGGERASPEVYSIVSNDPDASIIDLRGVKLEPDELRKANSVLRKMALRVFEGSPLSFGDRGVDVEGFRQYFEEKRGFISESEASEYAHKMGLPEGLAWKMCGAANAQGLLCDARYVSLAVNHFMNGTQRDVESVTLGDGKRITLQEYQDEEGRIQKAPIDHEYIATWLKRYHVVGAKMRVRSATLGGRQLDNYLLFDYEKVDTKEYLDERKRVIDRRLGAAALISGKIESEKDGFEVLDAINNLYASPEEVVSAVKKMPRYKALFESEVGVWERFTLGEHTETVLRNFERNYADKMHARVIPLVKMALLVHDIGKPFAVAEGRKDLQKEYNVREADYFMEQIGVNVRERWLVMQLINDGTKMAENYMIRRTPGSGARFYEFCRDTIRRYGRYEPDKDEITGLRDICLVLQTCDGAAYTDMAVTRSRQNGVYYRNYPNFNKSFGRGKGIDKRGAKLNRKG